MPRQKTLKLKSQRPLRKTDPLPDEHAVEHTTNEWEYRPEAGPTSSSALSPGEGLLTPDARDETVYSASWTTAEVSPTGASLLRELDGQHYWKSKAKPPADPGKKVKIGRDRPPANGGTLDEIEFAFKHLLEHPAEADDLNRLVLCGMHSNVRQIRKHGKRVLNRFPKPDQEEIKKALERMGEWGTIEKNYEKLNWREWE